MDTNDIQNIFGCFTCKAEAPACKKLSATSAESTPPIPRIGKSGSSFLIAVIALRAMGLVAFPETPPYVVRFSAPTAGHGSPFAFSDIKPETVLIAETPSALPEISKSFSHLSFGS